MGFRDMGKFTVAEFCVGGGGQALGLEAAGFDCVAAVEIDPDCCTTLRLNRPQWNVLHEDMREVDGSRWRDVDLFAAGGWKGVDRWAANAQTIAPTVVGGSKSMAARIWATRVRNQWRELGVDGLGIANEPPAEDFPIDGHPRLTVRMVARIQGFPDFWKFSGKKTAAYRQVGNAFPPPVASQVGLAIANALEGKRPTQDSRKAIQWRLLEHTVPYC